MLTEKTFDTGSVSINYAEGPPSGVPIVMLHGLTLRWQNFLPVLPSFMARYHVYALDRRGHGGTSRTPGAYTVGEDAEDIVAFLRQQAPEPAVLLGQSGGAMTSLVAAARAPDLVRAVVLADPPLLEIADAPESQRGPQTAYHDLFRALHRVRTMEDSREAKLSALSTLFAGQADASRLRAYLAELSHCDPEHLTFVLEGRKFAGYRLADLLPRISCPVLLIQGNPDLGGTMPKEVGERAAALLADCAHVFLPDEGHFFHEAQPHRFFRMVSNFLESLFGVDAD